MFSTAADGSQVPGRPYCRTLRPGTFLTCAAFSVGLPCRPQHTKTGVGSDGARCRHGLLSKKQPECELGHIGSDQSGASISGWKSAIVVPNPTGGSDG